MLENLFSPDAIAQYGLQLWAWIQEYVLVASTAIQFVLIAVAFGLSTFAARRIGRWLDNYSNHPTAGKAIRIVTPVLLPLLWLLLQWISIAAAAGLEFPARIVDSVAGLLTAWIAIRLVSQLVSNPIWSTLFVWVAWTIAALNILDWLPRTIEILDSVAIDVGELRISLYTVAQSTLVLAVLLSIAIYVTTILEARIRTSRTLSPSVQVLFVKSLKIVLIGLAIIMAINTVGIDLTALAVFSGALGLGVGFGLQKIVGNLISGVILLIDRSIKPGDVIAVSGTYGWVTALGGRYVSVVTRDGIEHLIPNEMLISERVENWTHTNRQSRLKVDVGVHYSSDVHRAIALCLEAAGETDRVLERPECKCLLIEFGDNSVNLQVRFWIGDAQNGVQNVKSAVLLSIWDKFKEHGIEIPYPQRDLHLRTGFEKISGNKPNSDG
jgi:small-conductance mechanosensitive channel